MCSQNHSNSEKIHLIEYSVSPLVMPLFGSVLNLLSMSISKFVLKSEKLLLILTNVWVLGV